jgi:hypothetical protein
MGDFNTKAAAVAAAELMRSLVAVLRTRKVVSTKELRGMIESTQVRMQQSQDPSGEEGARFIQELFEGDPVMEKKK